MKKTAVTFIILAVTMIILSLTSLSIPSARASSSYSIKSMNQTVAVVYNGYVLINDTVAISGQTDSFQMGFPSVFGPSIVDAIAYSTNDKADVFPVTLNVPLEDRPGFYGVQVNFSSGAPQVFSLMFVLSNSLLTQDSANQSLFTLNFPAFPSLTETVPFINCSVVVLGAQSPNGTISVSPYTNGTITYDAQNLSAFTYNATQVSFYLPENIQICEITQLSRQVSINAVGGLSISDSYYVANNSTYDMDSIEVVVPPNNSNLNARTLVNEPLTTTEIYPTVYQINFTSPVAQNDTGNFIVSYNLPSDIYVRKQANGFTFNMTLFQDTNSYIDQASVSFVLPEGARLSSFNTTTASNSYTVNRDVFQETMTVNQQNTIFLNGFTVNINYQYNAVWLAFLPTMVVWALAVVGCVAVAVWKRPRAPSGVTVPSTSLRLRPGDFRVFVDAYEEKMKIYSEIDVLDARVQKGKIPRSRYKVQKKTFEVRLAALDRTLAEYGGRIHSAGGYYSDLMRQLEVAETEIDEIEANMKSIGARHGRGEISLETYHKLLGDYERRRERAKTTIEGILLRLREEIH